MLSIECKCVTILSKGGVFMEKKIVPVIISTIAALDNALDGDFALLYLDGLLYEKNRCACEDKLKQFACRFIQQGKAGTFFQRKQTEADEDIHPEDIYDPLRIL